jgi:hypothetical protein
MPIQLPRPVSGFVLDAAASNRQLRLTAAMPGSPPVFGVSVADVRASVPGVGGGHTIDATFRRHSAERDHAQADPPRRHTPRNAEPDVMRSGTQHIKRDAHPYLFDLVASDSLRRLTVHLWRDLPDNE